MLRYYRTAKFCEKFKYFPLILKKRLTLKMLENHSILEWCSGYSPYVTILYTG